MIPVIDLEDAPLEEAVRFLLRRPVGVDAEDPESTPRGFNFVIRKARRDTASPPIDPLDGEGGLPDPDHSEPRITWHATNVILFDALRECARQTDYHFEIGAGGLIILRPKRPSGRTVPGNRVPPPPDPDAPFTGSPDPFADL